jgi:large conductance mechanosensitive channel
MRGNVIDLAVGVVIGSAFTAIVNSIVTGLITPLVAIIITFITGNNSGKIEGLAVKFRGQTIDFNLVINALLTFIITAFVLFIIVKAINKARTIGKKKEEEEAVSVKNELDYLEEIRDLLAEKK